MTDEEIIKKVKKAFGALCDSFCIQTTPLRTYFMATNTKLVGPNGERGCSVAVSLENSEKAVGKIVNARITQAVNTFRDSVRQTGYHK